MDNSSRQHRSDSQGSNGSFNGLQIFDSIENWLAGLFEWTEEEQEEAGIHLDDQRDE